MKIAIVGGGPAGLRAAEIAAEGGASVTLFEAKPSVGRKFLVAGRGGLNLTKAESREQLATHYVTPPESDAQWQSLIADFDADALREWSAGLGVETFVASTGRVYPREMKSAPLLRRWIHRLRERGVQFAVNHRWQGLTPDSPLTLHFQAESSQRSFETDAVILALGGGSWPQTGSDGAWTEILTELGVKVAPLRPANCGWEIPWSPEVLEKGEGQPLKNIVVRAGDSEATGELLITRYGLEGSAIYQLGPALRAMAEPAVTIDFKPAFTIERLIAKLGPNPKNLASTASERWRLGDAAFAIINYAAGDQKTSSAETLAKAAKSCPLPLVRPRPLAEAISSAGGVCWSELDQDLMIRRLSGVFLAGEMIDWEAPTGGYLIQGCFATATRAAKGAHRFGAKC